MEIIDLTHQNIEDIFWQAVCQGWGSGDVEKQQIPALPRYKTIPFGSGRFSVLDNYCTTPLNDKSAGFMTIWFEYIPVWTMSYGGRYPKRVIPFLKLALQSAIVRRDFVGCRGPFHFTHKDYPNLSYINNLSDHKRKFSNFSGQEIIRENGLVVGYHDYWGMSLI